MKKLIARFRRRNRPAPTGLDYSDILLLRRMQRLEADPGWEASWDKLVAAAPKQERPAELTEAEWADLVQNPPEILDWQRDLPDHDFSVYERENTPS